MFAPSVLSPDGTYQASLVLTTTRGTRFFSGMADASTVSMEVSIRGGAFVSDPDLISFDGTGWVVPNPSAYVDGLSLVAGLNVILVRSISATGEVSPPAEIKVTLVQESDVGVVAEPPTNISVESLSDRVRIEVEGIDDPAVIGYNFYCSTEPGGGASGYTRINVNLVDSGTTVEETTEIGVVTADNDVKLDSLGNPVADPLYIRLTGSQVDADLNVLQEDFDDLVEVPETATAVRVTSTVESVRKIVVYSFEHSRTAKATSDPPTVYVNEFASTSNDVPLYYVASAVYYDAEIQVEVESPFSPEVAARPVQVRNVLGTFPVKTRQQLTRSFIEAVYRSNPQVRVDPGSALRDVVIDPAMAEAERLRFILDFLHRASNFASLLLIDDPGGTGTSISVASSTYKQALKKAFFLTKDADVQNLIDRAFEACAARFGKQRKGGSYARGEVLFYTTTEPNRTLLIPLGTQVSAGSVTYKTTRAASIDVKQLASHYDPSNKRWAVTVPIKATSTGSAGNVGAGQVRTIKSAAVKSLGLSVTNPAPCFGGKDTETNQELAERVQAAIASVDSGTERGLLQVAADVPGVKQVKVVAAGDALMWRDFDGQSHRGGKVDVWVVGENEAVVTDTFAFSFKTKVDVQFEVVGDPADLVFRAVDDDLSSDTPIIEMLDDPVAGYELVNASTGQAFDLTGVSIIDHNTIALDTSIPQPQVSLSDVVMGSYRYRAGSTFIFPRQPVRAIQSVTGSVSGELDPEAYALYRPESPLGMGRSTKAGDYLLIVGTTDANGNIVPGGDPIQVEDEPHVLVGETPEYLDNLGCDSRTIEVKSEDGLTTYRGPNDSSGYSDYTIVEGDQTTAVAIKRVADGAIASGETVLVSYKHDENFTVSYTINQVLSVVQDEVDKRRHLTSDVLVKEAVKVPVDIEATVVLKRGGDQVVADSSIRTNLANLFARLKLGEPVRQSDITTAIDQSSHVAYVVEPLTRMVRQAGSQVVREPLSTDQPGDSTYISAWSTSEVSVWLLEDQLDAATTTGGGPETEYRGVFQDGVELDLQIVPPQTALGIKAGRAYIVGSDGIVIDGLTDDATLEEGGYTTDQEKKNRRAALTANRVLLSLPVSESPSDHEYAVTYIVGDDAGAKDITPSAAEYLDLGDVTLTFTSE